MRILQIVPFFSPERGGSVIAPYYLSKYLAKRGHEVTIYTTDYQIDSDYVQSLEDVRVVPFHSIANIGMMLISPGVSSQLKKEINDFDVIHMHNFRSYQNIIAHHYAKKYGIPYLLQAHGSVLPFFQKQILKKLYDWVWGYRILRDASKVIALTNTEAEQYKKMGVNEDKVEIIPNGIDLKNYENLPPKGMFKQKYRINDEKIILYLGRIHQTKGIDLLVDTFADLSKELKDVRLVIAGPDDGFSSTLKKQIDDLYINDRVLFTGPLYGRDKLEAYVDADVFVNPRADEIFGLVFLEANACGTPLICSKGCGIANVIDGKTGFAVHNDKDQLQDVISKILSDEELKVRFGRKGKMLVRKEFGWDKIVRKVEKVYLSLIER